MPISIKAMAEADFNTWVAQAKTKFANDNDAPAAPTAVAQNASVHAGDSE